MLGQNNFSKIICSSKFTNWHFIIFRDFVIRDFDVCDFVVRDFIFRDFDFRDYVFRDFIFRDFVLRDFGIRDFVPIRTHGNLYLKLLKSFNWSHLKKDFRHHFDWHSHQFIRRSDNCLKSQIFNIDCDLNVVLLRRVYPSIVRSLNKSAINKVVGHDLHFSLLFVNHCLIFVSQKKNYNLLNKYCELYFYVLDHFYNAMTLIGVNENKSWKFYLFSDSGYLVLNTMTILKLSLHKDHSMNINKEFLAFFCSRSEQDNLKINYRRVCIRENIWMNE